MLSVHTWIVLILGTPIAPSALSTTVLVLVDDLTAILPVVPARNCERQRYHGNPLPVARALQAHRGTWHAQCLHDLWHARCLHDLWYARCLHDARCLQTSSCSRHSTAHSSWALNLHQTQTLHTTPSPSVKMTPNRCCSACTAPSSSRAPSSTAACPELGTTPLIFFDHLACSSC